MATFLNSFFSKAGQVERLSNVGNYAKLAASKLSFGLIKAPAQNPTYKASGIVENIAQKVADHPYATAGVVASTVTAVKQLPKAFSTGTGNGIPAKTSSLPRRSTASKPGMFNKVTSAAGGMIQKAISPASDSPISPNTGIITNNRAAKAPSTRTRRTKRRSTRAAPKRKKARKMTRRKSTKRKSRKKRFGTAKQYKRKGGKSVKYTKNGQPYIILSNGRARFVKGKRK